MTIRNQVMLLSISLLAICFARLLWIVYKVVLQVKSLVPSVQFQNWKLLRLLGVSLKLAFIPKAIAILLGMSTEYLRMNSIKFTTPMKLSAWQLTLGATMKTCINLIVKKNSGWMLVHSNIRKPYGWLYMQATLSKLYALWLVSLPLLLWWRIRFI